MSAAVQSVSPLAAVETGHRISIEFTLGDAEMHGFARVSGDDNPLHANDGFAREHGFAGRVVFGGLLVATISRLLGTKLPGHGCVWHSLSINFRNPLYVGEPARLTGTVVYVNSELALLRLELRVTAGDRLIAEGEAQAGLAALR